MSAFDREGGVDLRGRIVDMGREDAFGATV
jgi:hypothetical protein